MNLNDSFTIEKYVIFESVKTRNNANEAAHLFNVYKYTFPDRESFIIFLKHHGLFNPEIEELLDLNNKKYIQNYKSKYFLFSYEDKETGFEDYIGFVGLDYPKYKSSNKNVFVDVYIYPQYRNFGLAYLALQKTLNDICNFIKNEYEHKKSIIHATVNKNNLGSIKVLSKLGFRILPESIQNLLRRRGVLDKDEIRLIYKCD